MDEIKNNKQDESQDTTPQETPAETPETTPQEETKTFSENELNKAINDALSAKGRDAKRLSDWEDSLVNRESQLRERDKQQRQEMRQKELDALADDADAQSKARYKHKLEDDVIELKEQAERERTAVTKMFNQAKSLIKQHNLQPDAISDLLDATSPREMELMAQVKAAEQEKLVTPTKKESVKPDSGISDAGAESDKALLKRCSEGATMSSSDWKRLQEIQSKASDEKLIKT